MDFASLDLNLLRVLDALLREGTTVKAGERMGLSQPAISAALGRLRLGLDDELFVRQGQRLVPTSRAARLAIPLREELARLESLLADTDSFDPARANLIYRLAGADFFAELLMPKLTAVVNRHAPGIKLQMVDLVRDVYVESLEQFAADIALHPQQSVPDWVERRQVMDMKYAVIAAEGHPAMAAAGIKPGEKVPLDLYCSLGHVVFSPEGNMVGYADSFLARIGRERRIMLTLPYFFSICRVVSQSELVAMMPLALAVKMSTEMGLQLYQPAFDIPDVVLVATWHRRNDGNPAHRWLRSQIFEILDTLNMPPLGEISA